MTQNKPHLAPSKRPDRRLHLALLAALAAAALVVLVVPTSNFAALPRESGQNDGAAAAVSAGGAGPYGLNGGQISFTIHQDGLPVGFTTSESTVGQALASAGIKVGKNDRVTPGLEAHLNPGMHVYISSARMVRVIFESSERLVHTHSATVGALLAELGISPQAGDRIFPGLDEPVRRGMSISLVTFRDGSEFTEDPIAYATEYVDDPNMLEGEHRVAQWGIEGYVRREYKVTRVNGEEQGRDLVNETRVEPTSEVIAVGTQVPATPVPAPVYVAAPAMSFEGMSCVRSMNVYATWYTAGSAGGGGVTATGTGVYKGIVAVDPSVIPLGTRMWIPGYGYGLAADTGGAIKGNVIDLGFGPGDVMDWRPTYTDICILG